MLINESKERHMVLENSKNKGKKNRQRYMG
jgi:hypothetical protein